MIGGFDPANSFISVVDQFSYPKAHIYGSPTTTQGKFTIELPMYDDYGKKVWIQYTNNNTTFTSFYLTVGTGMTGNGYNSTYNTMQFATSLAPNATSSALGGDNLSLGGYVSTYNDVGYYVAGTSSASTASSTGIRTLWVHMTQKSFSWATNQSATTNGTGWPSTWNSAASYAGPWIFTQTTRLDYWNKIQNGIPNLIYVVPKADGTGFCANDYISGGSINSDYSGANFVYSTRFAHVALPKINWIPNSGAGTPVGFYRNASTGYTAPAMVAGVPVNLIIKMHNTNSVTTVESTGSYPNGNTYYGYTGWYVPPLNVNFSGYSPNVIASIANTGGVESYTQNSWGWNKHSYGIMGGNVTDYTNISIVNAIYSANDEYSISGYGYINTYSIWPPFEGPNTRIGFAFSKR
jgi:hypothetical protein